MNLYKRLKLKASDYEAYKNFKFLNRVNNISHPVIDFPSKSDYHFKHSGNAGDIIYSIPAIKAIAKEANIHLHLNLGRKGIYGKNPHPLGDKMLNEKMVEMLKPLLLKQPKFSIVDIYTNQQLDADLDKFREYPLILNRGNIARWYFLTFAINYPLHKPWVFAEPDTSLRDSIVVARSQRYHAPGIDYSFLQQYPRVHFIGVQEEFEEMKQMVPNIEHLPVKDFLQMASYIAGCKLFIGNQSFPFSIAEGLKVNRLLEYYFQSPNVSVEGENGFDFCFQPHFEKLVRERFAFNV
jgi:ADP-heptose:LPS heptosyltransferase